MASTPSQNNAFELMTTGEKSGQWGDITNTNMEIIDRATKGVGAIALTTTSYSLDTVDYTASEGHYAVLVFAGTPGGTCTVTINPNDQQKVFIVRNTTPSSIVLTQGSGGNVTLPAGKSTIVYATGSGVAAEVVDVTELFRVLSLNSLSDAIDDSASSYFNVGLGTTALDSMTAGSATNNTAAGYAAGTAVTTGDSNTLMGANAGKSITTGSTHVVVGAEALSDATVTTSDSLVALGYRSGRYASGASNTFVGGETGQRSTGEDNVAVGYRSFFTAVSTASGARNTLVGVQTGASITSGGLNTYIGYLAGLSTSTGENNVALGAGAATSLFSGSNNIAIGYFATPSSGSVSNEITIGNTDHNVVRFPGTTTVSGLPSASTVGAGARSFVTDANATTFASVVAGGGSNGVPVYSDGTNWRIG